jgi:1-acyl-sn-glycerol-3-phosphate acyltransferase
VARSLAFHAAFYLTTILFMVFGLPLFLAPRSWVMWAWKLHSRTIVALLRIIAGVRIEVRGRERLPDGGYIVAAKHQSAWDTIALHTPGRCTLALNATSAAISRSASPSTYTWQIPS